MHTTNTSNTATSNDQFLDSNNENETKTARPTLHKNLEDPSFPLGEAPKARYQNSSPQLREIKAKSKTRITPNTPLLKPPPGTPSSRKASPVKQKQKHQEQVQQKQKQQLPKHKSNVFKTEFSTEFDHDELDFSTLNSTFANTNTSAASISVKKEQDEQEPPSLSSNNNDNNNNKSNSKTASLKTSDVDLVIVGSSDDGDDDKGILASSITKLPFRLDPAPFDEQQNRRRQERDRILRLMNGLDALLVDTPKGNVPNGTAFVDTFQKKDNPPARDKVEVLEGGLDKIFSKSSCQHASTTTATAATSSTTSVATTTSSNSIHSSEHLQENDLQIQNTPSDENTLQTELTSAEGLTKDKTKRNDKVNDSSATKSVDSSTVGLSKTTIKSDDSNAGASLNTVQKGYQNQLQKILDERRKKSDEIAKMDLDAGGSSVCHRTASTKIHGCFSKTSSASDYATKLCGSSNMSNSKKDVLETSSQRNNLGHHGTSVHQPKKPASSYPINLRTILVPTPMSITDLEAKGKYPTIQDRIKAFAQAATTPVSKATISSTATAAASQQSAPPKRPPLHHHHDDMSALTALSESVEAASRTPPECIQTHTQPTNTNVEDNLNKSDCQIDCNDRSNNANQPITTTPSGPSIEKNPGAGFATSSTNNNSNMMEMSGPVMPTQHGMQNNQMMMQQGCAGMQQQSPYLGQGLMTGQSQPMMMMQYPMQPQYHPMYPQHLYCGQPSAGMPTPGYFEAFQRRSHEGAQLGLAPHQMQYSQLSYDQAINNGHQQQPQLQSSGSAPHPVISHHLTGCSGQQQQNPQNETRQTPQTQNHEMQSNHNQVNMSPQPPHPHPKTVDVNFQRQIPLPSPMLPPPKHYRNTSNASSHTNHADNTMTSLIPERRSNARASISLPCYKEPHYGSPPVARKVLARSIESQNAQDYHGSNNIVSDKALAATPVAKTKHGRYHRGGKFNGDHDYKTEEPSTRKSKRSPRTPRTPRTPETPGCGHRSYRRGSSELEDDTRAVGGSATYSSCGSSDEEEIDRCRRQRDASASSYAFAQNVIGMFQLSNFTNCVASTKGVVESAVSNTQKVSCIKSGSTVNAPHTPLRTTPRNPSKEQKKKKSSMSSNSSRSRRRRSCKSTRLSP